MPTGVQIASPAYRNPHPSIHALRTAFRGNDARERSCGLRSIPRARDGKTMIQSVSSALDRRGRGFADTTTASCAYIARSRAIGTVYTPGSNAAICYTSNSRTIIKDTCESARPLDGVDLGMVRSRAMRAGAVNDPPLRQGCHALRWEREKRRTLGETETLDERRKELPVTPRGWIWKPSAARKKRSHVRRKSSLWHERGCDT